MIESRRSIASKKVKGEHSYGMVGEPMIQSVEKNIPDETAGLTQDEQATYPHAAMLKKKPKKLKAQAEPMNTADIQAKFVAAAES